jgi:hypothetical protein
MERKKLLRRFLSDFYLQILQLEERDTYKQDRRYHQKNNVRDFHVGRQEKQRHKYADDVDHFYFHFITCLP